MELDWISPATAKPCGKDDFNATPGSLDTDVLDRADDGVCEELRGVRTVSLGKTGPPGAIVGHFSSRRCEAVEGLRPFLAGIFP